MEDQKQLTETELGLIQLIKQDAMDVVSILGQLNYQKTVVELQIAEQTEKIVDIRTREDRFFSDLKDKYGDVSININTGEIF
jgi:hypothetical protein